MPLNLHPYTSPLYDYMHNFDLIHSYFSTSNCDYQIICPDGLDWEEEKIVEIVVRVCKASDWARSLTDESAAGGGRGV